MSDTTFNSESGGVADFMRVVSDNARLMHTIQAQKVRIATLERERDEAKAEVARLREACEWYSEMSKLAQRATLQVDNQAALHVLKEMALDGGKRLRAALAREGE